MRRTSENAAGTARARHAPVSTATLAVLLASTSSASPARAFDYPTWIPLPDRDVAVGITGGAAFGEDLERSTSGPLGGLDVSFLHGLFGLHAGLHAHREGFSWRAGGTLEASFWYVLLVGAGVSWGRMIDDGGPGIPGETVAATLLVGAPFLLARLGGAEGSGDAGAGGALVLVPFYRPAIRLGDRDGAAGHAQVGLSVRWTSFPFGRRGRSEVGSQ